MPHAKTSEADAQQLTITYALRHEGMAARESRAGRRVLTVNRHLWFGLRDRGLHCEWAFDERWHIPFEVSTQLAEEWLDRTFSSIGQLIFREELVWRRTNYYHFAYAAGHYLAALELARRLNSEMAAPGTVRIPIDPGRARVYGYYLPDEMFALFLKSLVPRSVFVDETSGTLLTEDDLIQVRLAAPSTQRDMDPRALTPGVDALVCPVGIVGPWKQYVPAATSGRLVLARLADTPSRRSLASASRRVRGLTWHSLRSRVRQKLSSGRGHMQPPTIDLSAGAGFSTVTTSARILRQQDPVEILDEWLQELWVPRLLAIQRNAERALSTTQARQVIISDNVLPETSLLATAALRRSLEVTLLPHSSGALGVDFWSPNERVCPLTPTKTGVRWWSSTGHHAQLSPRAFPVLCDTVERGEQSLDVAPKRHDALAILYIGGLSHQETYPVFDPQAYFCALQVVLGISSAVSGRASIAAKPRPEWETRSWYTGFSDVVQWLKPTEKLVDVLPRFDVAVVLELTSTALLEAIALGCVAVAVSDHPDAKRWEGNYGYGLCPFDRSVIPVVKPGEFAKLIQQFIDGPQIISDLRRRQAEWLAAEVSVST